MTIGQKGFFRPWGSSMGANSAGAYPVTVQPHQDEGFLSVQKANGAYVTFNGDNGQVSGETRNPPGGGERVTFDGDHIMVARPMDAGAALPFEWFNLSQS